MANIFTASEPSAQDLLALASPDARQPVPPI